MAWQYEVCPHCRHDSFHARRDPRIQQWQLICGGCKAVLIDDQPPLPTPKNQVPPTRMTPI